ncbi:hypothetical protein [Micromonospora sp. KC213]|uniref:hypothetical protein n=1 Tax=Micromonospora sp. KC213 TaxID=2530378 RepID=UPI001FB77835|nr:hypothetical protein [Micromonospora sp. KC213]
MIELFEDWRIMTKDASLMELLHRLDDPEWPEAPADYNAADAAASFSRLAVQVGSRFSTPCEIDRDIQDSAQYGRIEVPGGATVCGTRIVVLVSKFKPLAMVAADNPGAFWVRMKRVLKASSTRVTLKR